MASQVRACSDRWRAWPQVALLLVGVGLGSGGCVPSPLRNLARGCEQGSSPACFQLGVAYYEGKSSEGQRVDLDYRLARRAFHRGCDGDSGSSCYNLGYMVQKGEGGRRDATRAVGYYRRGCELHDFSACAEAGRAYHEGLGVSRDLLLVNQFAQPACENGEKSACALVVGASRPRPAASAAPAVVGSEVQSLVESCEAGSADSCFLAASRFDDGRGVAVDKGRAAELYKLACDGSDLRGCHNQAVMLLEGEGLPRNLGSGFRLLNRACDGGLKKSCEVMVHKLEKACQESRDADACTVMGRFLIKGDKGLPVNVTKGVDFLRRGCQLGDKDGCDDLQKLGLDPNRP